MEQGNRGGEGGPPKFVHFTGKNCCDHWLAWIFLHDIEANFLLANNAGGMMPNHMLMEGGFVSDLTSTSHSKKESNNKFSKVEKELRAKLNDIKSS